MMDWGMALSVGLGVAFISEVTILGAIMTPKVPLRRGRTWRGTVTVVSMISIVIGAVGGYLAGQFGGRGGGGAATPGNTPVTSAVAPSIPIATQTVLPQTTKAVPVESSFANIVDVYFLRDKNTRQLIHFTCEIVTYQRQADAWRPIIASVKGNDLADFLKQTISKLNELQTKMSDADKPNKRLRMYLEPHPGEGVYDQLRQQTQNAGWKVERKDITWQPDPPE
ncbi:MAG: hypothetical protein JNJ77_03455 [Planctomycetia bacterium]|nr:hypothetical protein [Planctomycetia bacterium]